LEERNWVLRAIADAGLDPRDFDDPIEGFGGATIVRHRPTGSSIGIAWPNTPNGMRQVITLVGDRPKREESLLNWNATVLEWLSDVRECAATPDLWAELRTMGGVTDAQAVEDVDMGQDEVPFSAEEQADIARRLDSLRAELEAQLSEAEARILAKQFEVIKDASKEMRRDRWRELVKGIMLGDVVNGQLPAPIVMRVFSTAAQFVGHLHGVPQLPPGH
jgi:hypothetical protein